MKLALNVTIQMMIPNEAMICGAKIQSVENTKSQMVTARVPAAGHALLLIMDFAD